jgi:CO/xanthine dehydrogenase Mo-binding subunit
MSIGQRATVLDANARVTGQLEYVLNRTARGCLSARILRSPYAHAELARLDASLARHLPGTTVLTGFDLARWHGLRPWFGPLVDDTPVLAYERVRYVGEPVAAVAAADDDAARAALALIDVDYAPLDAVFDAHAALSSGAPQVHSGGNLIDEREVRLGDVEATLASADVVVTSEYTTPAVQGVPLEPHVVLAETDGSDVLVYSATQTPEVVRTQLSRIFGLPLARVRVVSAPLGGGFGAKAYTRLEPIALALALRARRPVKLVLDRGEEFVTSQRPAAWFRLTLAARADGTLLALRAEGLYSGGASTETLPRVVRHGLAALVGPYRVPNLEVSVRAAFTNTPPCGPLRAPGGAQATWARESHLDALAARLSIDPLELRRRNLAQDGDRCVLGGPFEELYYPALLDAVAPRQQHSGATGRGVALSMVLINTPTTSNATLRLNDDGSLDVLTLSVDMGQGAHTVLAQIAAEALSLDVQQVNVVTPDTQSAPFDHATTSSRTTFSMGTAVERAAGEVRRQLLELGADLLEVSPADLELNAGRVFVRGAPEHSASYADIVRRARAGNLLATGTFTSAARPDPDTNEPGASAQYHQAACAAEVSVDRSTGKVRLKGLHAAVFAGRMINPTLCELQAEGNLVGGVGQALFEELVTDGGQLTNGSLADYTIPSVRDLPVASRIDIDHLEELSLQSVHGIGETLLPAVAPAIANAVFDACGARVADLPLTPEKLLKAMDAAAP